jgi:hypothetical protein
MLYQARVFSFNLHFDSSHPRGQTALAEPVKLGLENFTGLFLSDGLEFSDHSESNSVVIHS